jgi:hypothetical protein
VPNRHGNNVLKFEELNQVFFALDFLGRVKQESDVLHNLDLPSQGWNECSHILGISGWLSRSEFASIQDDTTPWRHEADNAKPFFYMTTACW